MTAGSVHLLFILLSIFAPPLLANILPGPKERSDTALPGQDLDFDLEDGILESQPEKDDTKKFLVDNLVFKQPEPDFEEFDPGPFQLLPAKRKYHEMIAADLFFKLLTKFALYMILVSSLKNIMRHLETKPSPGFSGDSDNHANNGASRPPCHYNWHCPLVVSPLP